MKATTDAASLRDLADWCGKFVPARPRHPISAAVHLAFTDTEVTASVTDWDVWGRATAPVVADTATVVAVSARLLAANVNAIAGKGNARVEIEHSGGGRLLLACRSMRAELPTVAPEDFPAWPTSAPDRLRALPGPLLGAALGHALAAAGKDDTLPMLTGILLESTADGLRISSTDRYRAPVALVPWLEPVDLRHHPTALVPGYAAGVMARSAKAADRALLAMPEEAGQMVVFGTPHRTVLSRLLDAKFPNIAPLFPSPDSGRWWTADADDLTSMAKSIGGLAEGEGTDGGRVHGHITITVGGGQITVTGVGAGKASGSMPVEHSPEFDADPWTVGVNAAFLVDAVAAVPADTVRVNHASPSKPLLLTPGGDPAYTASGLLMPVRLPATAERNAA